MGTSLYDLSIGTYKQIVGSTIGVLAKGAAHYAAQGKDIDAVVGQRLYEDMAPFHFQVVCVGHHSLATVKAMESGAFGPPTDYPTMDYAGLQTFLTDTLTALEQYTPDAINALAGGRIIFTLGGNEIPFTTENFVLTFSLPNLYFHATTAYDILRSQGVPLGKRDFMGKMRVG